MSTAIEEPMERFTVTKHADLKRERLSAFSVIVSGVLIIGATGLMLLLTGAQFSLSILFPILLGVFVIFQGLGRGMRPWVFEYRLDKDAGDLVATCQTALKPEPVDIRRALNLYTSVEVVAKERQTTPRARARDADASAPEVTHDVVLHRRSGGTWTILTYPTREEAMRVATILRPFIDAAGAEPNADEAEVAAKNGPGKRAEEAGEVEEPAGAPVPVDEAEAYYAAGNAKFDAGDPEAAIAEYDWAIELRPDYASAIFNRGLAHDEAGHRSDAIADFERVLTLTPGDAAAHLNLGLALTHDGQRARAGEEFRKVLELSSDPDERRQAEEELERLRE